MIGPEYLLKFFGFGLSIFLAFFFVTQVFLYLDLTVFGRSTSGDVAAFVGIILFIPLFRNLIVRSYPLIQRLSLRSDVALAVVVSLIGVGYLGIGLPVSALVLSLVTWPVYRWCYLEFGEYFQT